MPQATRLDRIASTSRSASARAAFANAVEAALAPYLDGDDEHFSEAVVLPDDHGKPALVMNAAPLGPSSSVALAGASARTIVFFRELNGRAGITAEPLRRIFGMTTSEANAALQLLEGGCATDLAGRLGVSLNSFKTQLQAAYSKTNTNRQAGLLRLILSLAPV